MAVWQDDEEITMMTEAFYQHVVGKMRVEKPMSDAAKRVLVDGLSVSEVVAETGVSQSHLSHTLSNIRDKAAEIEKDLEFEIVPIRLPKSLVQGALEQEKHALQTAAPKGKRGSKKEST